MSIRRLLSWIGLAFLTLFFIGGAAFSIVRTRLADAQPEIVVNPIPLSDEVRGLRLTVSESGLTAVTAKDLVQFNLPYEELSPNSLELTHNNRQIPFFVREVGNDELIYFYANANTDTIDDAQPVYVLKSGNGVRMAERAAAPTGLTSNIGVQEKVYDDNRLFLAVANGADQWFSQLLFAPSSIEIPFDDIQPNGGDGELSIRIWSNTEADVSPDHHLRLFINDREMRQHYWDGRKEETITRSIQSGDLRPSNNVLTITAPGDTGAVGEAIYIDEISIEYKSNLNASSRQLSFVSTATNIQVTGVSSQSLFLDTSIPENPILLTDVDIVSGSSTFSNDQLGSTYLVLDPSQVKTPQISAMPEWEMSLTRPDRGAEYIAIVADVDGFDEALVPLLEHREKNGLSVTAVNVAQIYDEFSDGHVSSTAIRDFIDYAQKVWNPAPRFVLLVGDASYDRFNYTEGQNQNLLPSRLIQTDRAGFVASDLFYVSTDTDLTPKLAIGRFPVQTVEQVTTLVNKTIAYENSSADEQWRKEALIVTGTEEYSFELANTTLSTNLANSGYNPRTLRVSRSSTPEYLRDAVVSAINQGVGIISYVGNGGIEVWGNDRIFHADDTDTLLNTNRLPVFTTFTTLNGNFVHPNTNSLAEAMLWTEDGGIVVAIAPSGRSFSYHPLPLSDSFYNALLTGQAETVGEALQQAKIDNLDQIFLTEAIQTVNLLGDPALKFQPAEPIPSP